MVVRRWQVLLFRVISFLTPLNWSLTGILVLAAFLRFWHLGHPAELYFDEIYHVPAIELISRGDNRAFEWWHPPIDGSTYFDWLHPPFAKFIQAGSVWIGREIFDSVAPFWWRLPSALAGVLTVYLAYVLTRDVTQLLPKSIVIYSAQATLAGLIAASIVATDGLLLVQSRIAMNDSLVVLLLVGALWLFLKSLRVGWQRSGVVWWFGLVMGLALATKWSAIFIWLFTLCWQLVAELYERFYSNQSPTQSWHQIQTIPYRWFGYVVIPLFVYGLVYLPIAWAHGGYQYVVELHRQIWLYQTHRDSDHAYASTPLQWVLNVRPVWYWRDEVLASRSEISGARQLVAIKPQSQTANIYASSHPLLPILGVSALASLLVWVWQKSAHGSLSGLLQKNWPLVLLFGAYLSSWVPWIWAPRIMFYYHYAPGLTILACLIGVWFARIWMTKKWLVWIIIIGWIVVEALWLPQWWGLRVSQLLADRIYFAISTWR